MKIADIIKIIHKMGLSWTIFRTTYEFKKRTGLLKRKFPVRQLSDEEFINRINRDELKNKDNLVRYIRENKENFILNFRDLENFKEFMDMNLSQDDKNKIIEIADNAIEGKIYCFSRWYADYGKPINWHKNPITNYEWPRDIHWVDLEELSKTSGDVKYVWEASRFPQIFYFVRAYIITKNEKYAQAYWEQVEDWIKNNRYQLGINWKCGQEISFRTFAWIFGLYAFLDSPHTTADRIFTLIKNIYLNAIRIEGNIDYAIKGVQNNHAISEAAGLFTVGLLFPFLKDSRRFLLRGKKFLEQEGIKQIYEDGSYIQHSNNYHRLMLQVYAWCFRLAELNKIKFSSELTNRLKLAINFLYQMQDESTGMVPNYGSNDGALVFPLSSCDYVNYKPQLNTINYIINKEKLYETGKHEEDLLWFCGIEAVKSEKIANVKRKTSRFDIGGYYLIRNNDSFGMVRCAKFKHRPGQADMLHFDLWYKGVNVLTDIGSYSYNPEEKFRGYFSATKNHNTIVLNNRNQTKKGPRFLTIDWPDGFLNDFIIDKDSVFFSGYHVAYKNVHTRKIEYKDNCYNITDEIENKKRRLLNIKLNWNVGTEIKKIKENKYKIIINENDNLIIEISSTSKGKAQLYCGDSNKPAGWKSLYYGEKIPMNQLVYEVESKEKEEQIITKFYVEKI